MRRAFGILALSLGLLCAGTAPTASAPARHTVTYDGSSLLLDGKRVYVWSGEFHYWRLPSPALWRDVLQKMKAAGFNATSIYFDWAYHSPAPGVYDFTGIRDVNELLDIAQQAGIYVIARPGPYINAETDSGGFPGWLTVQKGRARTSAPDYLAAALDWTRHIDAILVRHQFTNGGPIILYQVENEYVGDHVDRAYMAALERQIRADGITVPLTHNSCCGDAGRWARGLGAVNINGYDDYPGGFDCRQHSSWHDYPAEAKMRALAGRVPLYLAEFQGGSMDPWGGPGYDACARMTDAGFERVYEEQNLAEGVTMQSFYMTFGGTNWGWLASSSATYTSYDYGSIISETRALRPKYYEQKMLAYMVRTLTPLTHTVRETAPAVSDPSVRVVARVDPLTRTQFFIVYHRTLRWPGSDRVAFALHGVDGTYARIPQQPGTAITVGGDDSRLLVADFDLGPVRLVYSTSDVVALANASGEAVALLRGRPGTQGETVLRYRRWPAVRVQSGDVQVRWDAVRGDLRLDYVHRGLARVLVDPRDGRAPIVLLFGDDASAERFWAMPTAHGTLFVAGPYLVRTASIGGSSVTLTGDTVAPTPLEVFAPKNVTRVRWNGAPVAVHRTPYGTLAAALPGPQPVSVPALTSWRVHAGAPESDPLYDDSGWTRASGTLLADDYGFHYGDVWYRGHFTASGRERTLTLDGWTGNVGAYTVWLNGRLLGSRTVGEREHERADLAVPADVLRVGGDNIVSVLLANAGHDEDFSYDDQFKHPRGLTAAAFDDGTPIAWRIQGARTADVTDPVRGWMNADGLYGERHGWYLPGFDDAAWAPAAMPAQTGDPGVTWYRTSFALHVPSDQDVSIGVRIADGAPGRYRALIYVNGWQFGQYVNYVGPQHLFPIPPGIMRMNGVNTLAIAVWNLDAGAGPGSVQLEVLGNRLTSLRIHQE